MKKVFILNFVLMGLLSWAASAQTSFTYVDIGGNAPNQFVDGAGTLTVAENERVELWCWHDGGPASYQWLKDDSPISGGAERWIDFDEITMGDAGSYRVKVTVGSKLITSDVITINVVNGLAITAAPAGPVQLGSTVNLTGRITGVGSLSGFQWFKNGSMIQGATSPALTLANVSFSDAGEYSAWAFHPILERHIQSKGLKLKVYAMLSAPIIVTQPKDQVGYSGSSAVFTVGSSGTPPFAYQWQKNGADITGATDFFLGLNNLKSTDVGNYRVIVKNLSGSATSVVASLTLANRPAPNSVADSLVTSGRAALTQQTNTSLSAAAATFAAAVNIAPDHELAEFLLSITRIIDVINQAPANQFMDRLQIAKTNRNIYHWTAKAARDAQGDLIVPAGVDFSEGPAFLRDHLIPEIRAALTNLARIKDAEFTANLTAAETAITDLTVDQADLFVIRAGLQFFEYLLRTVNSWNLSMQLTAIQDMAADEQTSLQKVLEQYPQLLTFSDASQIGPGRAALESAIDAFVQASGMIRNRPEDAERLFMLGEEDAADEEQFRQVLLDLKASLDQVIVLNEQPQYSINYGKLLDAARPPRSFMPQFDDDDSLDPATLPDATFGGAFKSEGPPEILMQPVDKKLYPGSQVKLGVAAIGKEPLLYQWQKNGANVSGATNATLTVTNIPSSGAAYRVAISNQFGLVMSKTAFVFEPAASVEYDAFAKARILPGGGGRLTDSNRNASAEPGEPSHAGISGGKSLWYSWQAPVSGPVTINTIGSNFDTLLAVYTGTGFAKLTQIAADNDGAGVNGTSEVAFIAAAGTVYMIVVDGVSGNSGDIVLNIRPSLKLAGQSHSTAEGFRFLASGLANQKFVIEVSTDLRNWLPVATNTFPDIGLFQLADPQAATMQKRFYRAVAE